MFNPQKRFALIRAMCLFLLITTLVAQSVLADADSKGKDFWLMFPGNLSPGTLTLFITGSTSTTGNVSIPGLGFSTPITVTPGAVTSVVLPISVEMTASDAVQNKGIHVTALDEVTVYGLNRRSATTDAFLGLPTDILGTEYINIGYGNSVVRGTQLGVVATENGTTVTITPSVTTGTHTAGVPYIISLNQGQTYLLRNTGSGSATDLTGTIIISNKPVGVFGGHQCANVPAGVTYCDHVVEQLPPTSAWGKNFVTVPLKTRKYGDTFRFLASTNGTTVSVNGVVVATLNRGQFHERIIATSSQITSNQPILVAQYSNGTSYDGVTSDPFMMLIPPYEQFLGSYTVTTPASGFRFNFINVVVPNAGVGSVTLDGTPVPAASFSTIGTSGFSGAQLDVGVGTHNLSGTLPFGAFMYGFDSYDSYGYPGGMSLAPVATVTSISLSPPTATNPVGANHCVTATVRDQFNNPVVGVRVDFAVSGANSAAGFSNTSTSGQAQFCYVGNNAGNDAIVASVGTLNANASSNWFAIAVVPSFSVTPPTSGHICLPPFMVQDPARTHSWWAQAAGTGNLEIEFSAVAVNPIEVGTAYIRVYNPSNTLIASDSVAHPASGETPITPIVISSPSAGSLYRIEVNVAPASGPGIQVARHYRLGLDGATQLGANSPLQAQAENESVRWGVNVGSGEPLNVVVQPGPEAGATMGSVEVRNPGGSLVTTASIGTPVSLPFSSAGMWTLTIVGADHHYIIHKTSGSDRGLYVGAFSDIIAPSIFAPLPVSVSTGPGATTCGVVVSDEQLGFATAKDNCEVTITRTGVPAGNFFPVGTTIITYTATDGGGNTTTGTQTVTVIDNTPPALTAPPAVSVATGPGATTCGVVVSDAQLGNPTASDNCAVSVTRTGVPPGNLFSVGTTTITYTATDPSGNSTTATQTVTVIDNTPPTIACGENIFVTIPYDQTSAVVEYPAPTASDNCSVTTSCSPASGSSFAPGTTTVTCTATDSSGNTASCSFTVTVNRSPGCTATPSIAQLWPPNHRMVDISIVGVTDPDGDPVTIIITGITQDEPLNTVGDGNFEPDGAGVGTSVAQVRAERTGTPRVPGNGRVYQISYSASDGRGGECTGSVAVCVPHDQGNRSVCIDDGQRYNSVTGATESTVASNGALKSNGDQSIDAPLFMPTEYGLFDAYPNPFNPSTKIQYDIPEPADVRLRVFDMLGREVALLVNGQRNAGRYTVQFDASGLTSGVYIYRIEAGKFVQTKKLVLMK